ncbi:unnamed protein product [Calypogeia fissa]
MYSESATDGGSLFGGGGFMPSQSGAALNNDSSFSPGGATTKRNTQNTGLLPLTVKQLSMASQRPADDNFYVDGQEVNNITLVGMIHSKEEKATDVSFQLDDFTGRIEVKKWIDGQDSEELSDLRNLRNESYVRVHGHLRSFQGKRNVVAFSVRAIEDFNEITFHFLECIFVHLTQTKKTQGVSNIPTNAGVYGAPVNATGTLNQGANNTSSYNQYSAPPAAPMGGNSADAFRKRVQAFFEEPSSTKLEYGLHRNDVMQRMVGFTREQVNDAIDFLVNEGHVYSTIDDDHFKSATS